MDKMGRMKFVFFILSIFFLCGIVGAVYAIEPTSACNTGESIVMRLSGVTNAHGELASQNNYGNVLCVTNVVAPSCTGSNVILRLSGVTNAVAEVPGGATYNNLVCGNTGVVCESFDISQRSTCSSGYEPVVSLSGVTNAHIGAFSDYNTKICCAPSVGSITEEAKWINGNNQEIQTNSDVSVGSTVGLSYTKSDLTSGRPVSFNVKYGTTSVVTLFQSSYSPDGKTAKATWVVPANLVGKTLYFEANALQPVSPTKRSKNDIKVVSGSNVPPTVTLDSPIDRQIYFNQTAISFNYTVNNPDDQTNTVEVIFDGTVQIISVNGVNVAETVTSKKFTGANINTGSIVAKYITSGQKNIKVTVNDSGGATGATRAAILTLASYSTNKPNVLSYVSYPRNGEIVSVDGNGKIKISAGDADRPGSYVVKSIGDSVVNVNSYAITCIAGRCPQTSEGTLAGRGKIGVLNYNDPAVVELNGSTKDNLRFTWKGGSETDATGSQIKSGKGNETNMSSFYKPYQTGTNYWVELTLDYLEPATSTTATASSIIRNDFSVTSGVRMCQDHVWQNPDGTTSDPTNSCRQGSETCCPVSADFCGLDNVCVNTGPVSGCETYPQSQCNFANGDITYSNPLGSQCVLRSQGWCKWDSSSSRCEDVVITNYVDPDVSDGDACLGVTTLSCEYTTKAVGDCQASPDGTFHYEYAPTDANPECVKPNSEEIPCKEASLVPFFSLFNVFSVVGILIVFYTFVIKKRKNN